MAGMKPTRKYRRTTEHYGILVNQSAANYDSKIVDDLIAEIKRKRANFSIAEPSSAMGLMQQAQTMAGLRRIRGSRSAEEHRRGKITKLVVCGGDGTFNLAARAALKANLPIGIIPLGKENNIAISLFDSVSPEEGIKRVFSKNYKSIDYATVANQMFFGSLGIGLIPNLERLLQQNGRPRFKMGWSSLGTKAALNCNVRNTIIKVDAFRFELSPLIFNVNLLPYSAGIKVSPVSGLADGLAEVIFDINVKPKEAGKLLKQLSKEKFWYGSDIRMYRGKIITIQPAEGMLLYLDGELLTLPTNFVEIEVGSSQLKVCSE